ncbi:hypothetical protein M3689_00920 [Alkalihalophilus marmarensis]|uniref:hypothetical protein n=1 Tax=Alkalihalophilus marmarensis TaxID=521377 RepID=UPI00203FFF44|nr:hypothetical protein [Alkalihalophilus marmarensis]MCM3487861.1 hypothetical protein [Alkalihalophilus marmarensis]
MAEYKVRKDLIGTTATRTLDLKIVDAHEYEEGVSIRVVDNMGEEYWTGLEDVELDR